MNHQQLQTNGKSSMKRTVKSMIMAEAHPAREVNVMVCKYLINENESDGILKTI